MKRTKTKLLSSIAVLLICFAMLIGSTFAWFTDTASTGVNTIQAGNLDIVLEYYDGDSWEPVTESTKLFKDDALWEPGHTEVAYLHIKNNCSLDLKYKMNVNIPSETETVSINQKDGTQFKLSDYLVFGKVVTASESFFGNNAEGRTDARTAAGDIMGLSSWTREEKLFAASNQGKHDEYVALVIYMPETVGNEANHKTGEPVPQIQLGVNVVATQLNSEADSFNSEYDADATYPVISSAIVKQTENTTVQVTVQDTPIKVTAPAGSLPSEVEQVFITAEEASAPSTITVASVQGEKTFEVTLKDQNGNKVNAEPGTVFETTLPVGANRDGLKLYHSGVEMTDDGDTLTDSADHYIYNSETGIVTMKLTGFSPVTYVYDIKYEVNSIDDLAPLNGSNRYVTEKGIYVLQDDITVDKLLRFNEDVVIDLNNHTLNANGNEFRPNKTTKQEITIKNGTISVKDYSFWWNAFKGDVTINLENVTINASKASAVFRTMPTSVSHKLTINSDENSIIYGTFSAGDPTYSSSADTPSVSNIVVNGVNVNAGSNNAVRLYGQYKNSSVTAEFNSCSIECTSYGSYPVYCGAKPAENGTVYLTMNDCELKAKRGGISNAIFGYNNDGITVNLNNCTDVDEATITIE